MYFLSFIMSVISLGSPIRFSLMVFVVMLASSVVVIVSVSLFMYLSMSFFVDLLFSVVLVSHRYLSCLCGFHFRLLMILFLSSLCCLRCL